MNSEQQEQEREFQRAWAVQLLASAQQKQWYGTITIKIEKGKLVRVQKEESILPPTAPATKSERVQQ